MGNRLNGRITDLNVSRHAITIKLDNSPKVGPKDNVFTLPDTYANYSASYSLVLAAAANRWPITIRITGDGDISAAEAAEVAWVAVGWRAGASQT